MPAQMNLNEMFSSNKQETSPEAIFQKRKQVKAEATSDEPSELPTEDVVEEEVADDVDDVKDDAAQPEEGAEDGADKSEDEDDAGDAGDSDNDDNDEDFFVDLDGEEISFSEIRKMKEGALRQSDYTKKTTELAEQRKAVEQQQSQYNEMLDSLKDKAANLEVLINEADEEIDWDDLKEFDPAEYLVQKEKQDKRKDALNKVKEAANVSGVDEKKELEAFVALNPAWVKDGSYTKAFEEDMTLVQDYLGKQGLDQNDIAQIKSHKLWNIVLNAAKGGKAVDKSDVAKKRVKKAPVVTKSRSKAGVKSDMTKQIEAAEAKFKKTGHQNDLAALRKLRRQKS